MFIIRFQTLFMDYMIEAEFLSSDEQKIKYFKDFFW